MKKSFEYGKILKEAGFTAQQVQSQISVLTDLTETNMATKTDIKDLDQSITSARLELKAEINNLHNEINDLRTELNEKINNLRAELNEKFNQLRLEIDEINYKLNGLEERIVNRVYKKMVTTNIALFTLFFSLFKFLGM